VVRTHPVTGWKTLYVNENFTKELVGLERRFSHALLDNLFRTIAESYEYQVRWKWSKNAVAIWDNRATFHTGIFDYGRKLEFSELCFTDSEQAVISDTAFVSLLKQRHHILTQHQS
jgi:sulfonate dioxygenase